MKAALTMRPIAMGWSIDLTLETNGAARTIAINGAINRADTAAIMRGIGAALLLAGYAVTGS